ncbi:MAG: hypothetical protein M1819_004087 [Sarea resinae]|nr:MAG: hypothetical protein M1819_004087 [Sarea resinae]
MPSTWQRSRGQDSSARSGALLHWAPTPIWVCVVVLLLWASVACGMTDAEIEGLRQETVDMFFHGYNNYMDHAFPEDELRPITCKPLSRDRENPAHVELNDVLGNYSLTLIDSLSTLAIMASSSWDARGRNKALEQFQEGTALLVEHYGDGTEGSNGLGSRARGFDVDSKVQVFETVIRGVGGLLSAHLFAIGELPIRGYRPYSQGEGRSGSEGRAPAIIEWPNGFRYDGQLLRLAYDLGKRLLPAFHTPTGMPYPRVNLRHGIPFYANSPLNLDAENGQCKTSTRTQEEITETCSAGAGSLVLEFATLSRLTGDDRFERLAKRAFWAVLSRRSNAGLVGSGIDAETGHWIGPYTGVLPQLGAYWPMKIGAGIDSFFEYALKSHVLLSGLDSIESNSSNPLASTTADPHISFPAWDGPEISSTAFLEAWHDTHSAIKRHLYRGREYQHPHYIQADLSTGAMRAFWLDSLSAYYPGLLTLAGQLDEAIEAHLLYTALWTRFSALPERWSTATGNIEGGLGWWGGRPEFIESTWYLFRATNDPWYLHVGEMTLRDIKRRCWTKCGWAGLQDVRTGEHKDRMESFFLGETAKYLFLLFDPSHPLNTLDAPYVFTTEGHPLIIPRARRKASRKYKSSREGGDSMDTINDAVCAVPSAHLPFTISATAARGDLFHAGSLARLHLMPNISTLNSPLVEYAMDHPSISLSDLQSPTNYTFFPWTLPPYLIPSNGTCSKMFTKTTFDISFPTLSSTILGPGSLSRIEDGIVVTSMSGLRLGMIRELSLDHDPNGVEVFRIYAVSHIALGRDEKVYVSRDIMTGFNSLDPNFTRLRDPSWLDLVVDFSPPIEADQNVTAPDYPSLSDDEDSGDTPNIVFSEDYDPESEGGSASNMRIAINALLQHISTLLSDSTISASPVDHLREALPAIIATGNGAAPMPDVEEAAYPSDTSATFPVPLLWNTIYISDDTCTATLPAHIPRTHQIIVMKRGGCSFSRKLQNIPSYPPSSEALQLVIVVSYPEMDDRGRLRPEGWLIQPLLEDQQTSKSGIPRRNPIPLVMMGGGDETIDLFKRVKALGFRRRYQVSSQGIPISNLVVL